MSNRNLIEDLWAGANGTSGLLADAATALEAFEWQPIWMASEGGFDNLTQYFGVRKSPTGGLDYFVFMYGWREADGTDHFAELGPDGTFSVRCYPSQYLVPTAPEIE